jgi:hypothetical protein
VPRPKDRRRRGGRQDGDLVVTHQRITGFHSSELDVLLRSAGSAVSHLHQAVPDHIGGRLMPAVRASTPDAFGQRRQTRPGQLPDDPTSTAHGHQQRLRRAFDDGPGSAGPVEVGGGQGEAFDALLRPEGSGGAAEVEGVPQPVVGDRAGQAEWAADVLVVDDAVGQGDPAAEGRGQPAGLQVAADQREQFVG